MMSIAKLSRLSPSQIGFLLEGTAVLALAAFAIAFVPFRRLAGFSERWAGVSRNPPASENKIAADVGWAVQAMSRRVPWRAKCFEQGLAAQWMLCRRGIAVTLHYGLARDPDRELMAHVWVKAAGLCVTGSQNAVEFAELGRFPAMARGERYQGRQ